MTIDLDYEELEFKMSMLQNPDQSIKNNASRIFGTEERARAFLQRKDTRDFCRILKSRGTKYFGEF